MRVWLPKFVKDYALPLSATFLLIVSVGALMLTRHYERVAVVNLARNNPLIRNTKNKLVSEDKAAPLKRDQDNSQTKTDAAKKAQPPSAQKPSPSASPSSPGGFGGGTQAQPPPGVGGPETPQGPFTVDIDKITYYAFPMSAPNGQCAINHGFSAHIHASNGPGAITYHWERSDGTVTADQQIYAGSGDSYQMINYSWFISSNTPYDGWVKLVITTPNTASQTVNFHHEC